MYFLRSKTTLDSLKSVFNVFRGKSSLGAPEVTEPVCDNDTVLNHCSALTTVSRDHLSMTVSYHFAPYEGKWILVWGFQEAGLYWIPVFAEFRIP